jgi:hypothetical protein
MLLYAYYMLMVSSFIISIFFYKSSREVRMISQLLFVSILTEMIVEVCKIRNYQYYLLYHFFTPIEYTYIALYFYYSVSNAQFKKFCLISIFLFVSICLLEIILNYNLQDFPRFLSYVECFLIIISSIVALLYIEVDPLKSIFKAPNFWFSIAFLFFNAALFLVLFFDHNEDAEIKHIFYVINRLSNCILYSLLAIGFLCLKKKISHS